MPGPELDARSAYAQRLTTHRRRAAERGRVERRLALARLTLFVLFVVLLWPAAFADTGPRWSPLVPLAAFAAIALRHDRVIRARRSAERAAAYYERGLARLDDRWSGQGDSGEGFANAEHPCAADLDLFGPGSLFELLCAARTSSGRVTLARWLTDPATPNEVLRRQAAVGELRPRLDLREELAVLGEDVGTGVDPRRLIDWASAPPILAARWPAWVAAGLAALNSVSLTAWWLVPWAGVVLGCSLAASGVFALLLRTRVRRVLGTIERPERELELLALVLRRLERERFRSPLLVELRGALDTDGHPPSRVIRRLARLVETCESRYNMLFAPLAALLLLGTQLAFALERWRGVSGGAVRRWLEATGEIEALCSLAAYAFERPADPFPEIVERGPCFDGRELGHPLLPASRCVRNDVRLGDDLRCLVVSGSNMSGKSTLLRTVGVNCVLALAGAPVRASSLRLSPLDVGASMRLQDSLQQGTSHFYAELQRLRRLVDVGQGSRRLLFLLDELFHGTNSHDRKVGAHALIRGLIDDGGIGLVTTHDLALAEIADDLAPRAANVHFEDRLEDQRILFDYKLRPGVVRRSNAIALMRAVGLEV